jgi:hypothetical protein
MYKDVDRIRRINVAERRARLIVRHHPALAARTASLTNIVADLLALHGTDPASVYLAAWALSHLQHRGH